MIINRIFTVGSLDVDGNDITVQRSEVISEEMLTSSIFWIDKPKAVYLDVVDGVLNMYVYR